MRVCFQNFLTDRERSELRSFSAAAGKESGRPGRMRCAMFFRTGHRMSMWDGDGRCAGCHRTALTLAERTVLRFPVGRAKLLLSYRRHPARDTQNDPTQPVAFVAGDSPVISRTPAICRRIGRSPGNAVDGRVAVRGPTTCASETGNGDQFRVPNQAPTATPLLPSASVHLPPTVPATRRGSPACILVENRPPHEPSEEVTLALSASIFTLPLN